MSELADWDNFYSILGSAAATLIGLQFIVLTLVADTPQLSSADAGSAFASPTIFHLSVVLLLSALLRAPWPAILPISIFLGVIGLGGIIYNAIVSRRMKRQSVYKPVLEDWIFYSALPLASYVLLLISARMLCCHVQTALYGLAAATLLLLFLGIRNSWDSISHHVFVMRNKVRRRDGNNQD